MSLVNFQDFMQKAYCPISMGELVSLLSGSQNACLFIKDGDSAYCFANHNYIQLMGLNSLDHLLCLNDRDLSKDKKAASVYRDLDSYVLEEGKALSVSETICPQYNQPLYKTMQGTLYPLFSDSARANFVLGVVLPELKLLKLDFDTIFKLNPKELQELLIKRRYKITLGQGSLFLSKMEICVLVQLIKGAHAGEIAQYLGIQQSTVESYLVNIKNKLAVDTKSELIHLILSKKLLEQIII